MQLNIQTSRTFTDILHGPRIVVLQGGTRSGKSYSAVQYLIVKALEESDKMISIVRKSFPSLRISTLRDFKEIMKSLDIWDEESWRASENAYTFPNGSIIEFLSVQDGERRKGSKRDYLFVDEITELDYEDYFQLSIRTTEKIIVAFNPNIPATNWIFTQLATHPEAQTFISTYNDNPFLDDTLVKEIELLRTTSPSYWKIYGEGQVGVVEGLVFDNVSITDYIPEDAELLGYGLDFGFTNDPTALISLWRTEEGILFDEICYMKGLLSNQIANMIRAAYDNFGRGQVIADSSDPRLIDEIFRSGNINIKPCVKGPDSIMTGIDTMKQNKIFITKKSSNLIDEFFGYVWMKDKNNELMNKPDGRYPDHGIDAARYVASWFLSTKKKSYGTYNISLR